MSSIVTEELSQRVNRLRDDQARFNRNCSQQLNDVETESESLANRFGALVRLLIAKQVISAEEFAALAAEAESSSSAAAGGSTTL